MRGTAGIVAALLGCGLTAGPARAGETVVVENFPSVQGVEVIGGAGFTRLTGEVEVVDTQLLTIPERLLLPLTRRSEADDLHLFDALGTLDVTGFRRLSARGAGRFIEGEAAGAELELVLLPDVRFIQDVYQAERRLLLQQRVPLRVAAAGGGFFTVVGPTEELVFPRYRAWLRNRSGAKMQLHLYLYLTD